MEFEFMAKDELDAAGAIMLWIVGGILPNDKSYTISPNKERPGYFVATAH